MTTARPAFGPHQLHAWCAAALCATALWMAPAAQAAPIHVSFNGQVSGPSGIGIDFSSAVPAHTAVSFSVNFYDRVSDGDLSDWAASVGPVSGWLNLGGRHYDLSGGGPAGLHTTYYPQYAYEYGVRFTGTGPDLGLGENEFFFGLFLQYSSVTGWGDAMTVGFGVPFEGGGSGYGYLDLAGQTTVGPAQVPEPGSAALVMLALAGLAGLASRAAAGRSARRA